jgi:ribosomal protein L11 methyltransferase
MQWTELSIHTTEEAIEPISYILHESGASGVAIEDPKDLEKTWDSKFGEIYALNPNDYPKEGVIIKAYLAVNDNLQATIEEIKKNVAKLVSFNIDIGLNEMKVTKVNEEDWATAWKKYYKPIKVSNKITIVPTWEEYEKSNEELIIELDPGMAFGTGTHPTTIMCIQALEKYVRDNDRVIDVGTGSGVLSIASAKLNAKSVHAYDLDQVAVESALSNINLNDVADHVLVKQNNLLDGITNEADIIVANLLADIILLFVEDAYALVKPGGYYITSGIIEAKEQDVVSALKAGGFIIKEILRIEDWVAIVAQK